MTNPKGTAFETLISRHLQRWWPNVERRARTGAADRGDIAGIPGLCIEAKNCRRLDLAGWVEQAHTEAANCGNGTLGIVVHKRRGKGAPGDQYVTMTVDTMVSIFEQRRWK